MSEEKPGALLKFEKALETLLGKFDFDGVFTLKSSVSPGQTASQKLLGECIKMEHAAEEIESIQMWTLGNIAYLLAKHSGMDYIHTKDEIFNLKQKAAIKTFLFFRDGKFRLSWKHHKEIAHMLTIDKETKLLLAKLTEEKQLPISAMRKVARILKKRFNDLKEKKKEITSAQKQKIVTKSFEEKLKNDHLEATKKENAKLKKQARGMRDAVQEAQPRPTTAEQINHWVEIDPRPVAPNQGNRGRRFTAANL